MTNERTADADADAALLRDALGLPDDYGDENTAIIQRQHAALDRLVARNQQLQEALAGPIREHLREAGSIIHSNSDHPERIDYEAALGEIDKCIAACRAALASVRTRTPE